MPDEVNALQDTWLRYRGALGRIAGNMRHGDEMAEEADDALSVTWELQ
jgi:hypothetical protein